VDHRTSPVTGLKPRALSPPSTQYRLEANDRHVFRKDNVQSISLMQKGSTMFFAGGVSLASPPSHPVDHAPAGDALAKFDALA
jgi:hypothetical protein